MLKGPEDEVLDENFQEGVDYIYKKSSCSMVLNDIQGILFGGLSSRFWMLRKHIICSNVKKLVDHKAPFFSWQCLTIQLKHRDVDLVIPNDKDMDELLELIVDTMVTVNGVKGSAKLIYQKMHYLKYIREYKRQKELAKRNDMS